MEEGWTIGKPVGQCAITPRDEKSVRYICIYLNSYKQFLLGIRNHYFYINEDKCREIQKKIEEADDLYESILYKEKALEPEEKVIAEIREMYDAITIEK